MRVESVMKSRIILWTIAVLFLFNFSAFASVNNFVGEWENTDPRTRGTTRVSIRLNGEILTAQVYGKCHPSDCDWGISQANIYASKVEDNLATSAIALIAKFRKSGIDHLVIFKIKENGLLQADIFIDFIQAGDRRSNYNSVETFRRILENSSISNNKPITPVVTPPANDNLHNRYPVVTDATNYNVKAPVLISPEEATVFNHYPRKTKLVWNPVPEAVRYLVEVDYYYRNGWHLDYTGQKLRSLMVPTTEFEFNFVGAQPGRWRVAAVLANGEVGVKSEWRTFRYTG